MAQQPSVQYIRFYTDGSTARKMDVSVPRKSARKPASKKKKWIVLHIDPVATMGIIVAALMLVLMAVGVGSLQQAQQEAVVMERYVESLRQEHLQLQQTYDAGFDAERVEQTALALGMVPMDQVKQCSIQVSVPQHEVQPSGWEQLYTFLMGLFA